MLAAYQTMCCGSTMALSCSISAKDWNNPTFSHVHLIFVIWKIKV